MKRIPLIAACLLVALLAFSQTVHSQGGQGRAQLDRFSSGLESLHASFEQRVISSDGSIQASSSGQVWLSRPRLFRWEYGGDFPELVVADGSRIWIYDKMLEQVTVRNQSGMELDSPLMLLTNPGRLDEQFEVREVGEAEDGIQLLELRARTMETEFERILLGLRDDQLLLMVIEDSFGLRTELRFGQIERNPKLDMALFAFEPPESVDVIGDLP